MTQKRFHIVLASILFAVLVWISINMGYEYTVVEQIPVVVENLRPGKAFKSFVPKTITAHFRGTGWQCASLALSARLKYYVDVGLTSSQNYIVTSREFAEHVKLPMTLQAIKVEPETLILSLDELIEKRVPVNAMITVRVREGFGQVGALTVHPDSVRVVGARSWIDSLTNWNTVFREFNDQRSGIDEEIPLEESPGLSCDVFPKSVSLKADIQQFAEKTFSGIPVIAHAAPDNRDVIFIPSKLDVIVRGGIDELTKFTSSDFQATVEYSILRQDSSGMATPIIDSPPGVRIIRRQPERFQFVIRKHL